MKLNLKIRYCIEKTFVLELHSDKGVQKNLKGFFWAPFLLRVKGN